MGNREKSIFEMPRNSTVVLKSVEKGMYHIAMKSSWLRTYVTSAMGDVHFFLETVNDGFYVLTPFGCGSTAYALERFYNLLKYGTISATLEKDDMRAQGLVAGHTY